MKPFKNAEEFKKFLDKSLKEHEKRGHKNVHLPTLKKLAEERE